MSVKKALGPECFMGKSVSIKSILSILFKLFIDIFLKASKFILRGELRHIHTYQMIQAGFSRPNLSCQYIHLEGIF